MKKSRVKQAIMAIISVVIVTFFIMIIMGMLWQHQKTTENKEWIDGWSVSVNGDTPQSGKPLPEYKFSELGIGDEVVMTNRLPEEMPRNQILSFLTYLSTVEVTVDGEVVYSYGEEYARKKQLVGSGYHYISIPDGSGGKELVIRMEIREDKAFTNILTPTISDTEEIYEDFAKRNMLGICVGMFLTLLGIVLMFVSGVAFCYNRTFARLIYIGAFSFLVGVWSMCNMKVLQVFHVDLAANTTTEYLTLYFAPVAFGLLIADVRKGGTQWRRQVVLGVSLLLLLFAVVTTFLQFLNIEHYPSFLGYFHVFGAASLVIVAVSSFDKTKKMDRATWSLYAGIGSLLFTVALDLVRFNLQKYVLQDNEWLTISVIPLGALLFIVFLLISYVFYIYSILVDKAEREWLTERAYRDELCGIYNRTKCNEVFDELNKQNRDYAFVNIDMNGLKGVNDSLGHLAGDQLLKEFAQILQAAFRDIGQVFRMSGDEFMVIIREEQFPQIDQCLNRMVKMEKRRSADLPFIIDASYGVAKHSECMDGMTERVYTLADQRMYEMKTKKKINRRLRK
ncbi:MAG: GGDEF domain-containing protein [Lachnospiraceae bacterium]|nr:GGDEF domain-containing protein [Lachnospiraceae bacterium]